MHDIALGSLTYEDRYALIVGSVTPRPIALVTTLNSDGSCNAAPFSSFNYMSVDPPLVAIGIERYGDDSHRAGDLKDTLVNLERSGEFVVNMVDHPLLEQAVGCAIDYPANVSETVAQGLEVASSRRVQTPRLAKSPISLECRLFDVLGYSKSQSIVLGEIVSIHFSEGLLDLEKIRVNLDAYFPMCRLTGPNYAESTVRTRLRTKQYSKAGVSHG
ncbi:flavin reductase family protein [Bradyrhizobium brasilense]|uniref:flavin reductase family protein n=1 Tax=Bradyrhizobium brasilense TaxID=1419277 RepID=UPI0014577C51|nr:flavin reductase family protein [Bradyrhizobium brasilense]NLS75268.1 flavin reductase family protein [Bradyrhizobium brasilense]